MVFGNEKSVKQVLRTAAEGKELQVQFDEPRKAFGLKGSLASADTSHTYCHPFPAYPRPAVVFTGKVEAHKAKTPGNAALQQQLDTWMEQWELGNKTRDEAAAAVAADEGWTVVARHRVLPFFP